MTDDARQRRGEEYADQAVQDFVGNKADQPRPEKKKIVIPSREARTVRTKHDDIPELAAALKKERDRQEQEALIAAGYAPTPVSTNAKLLKPKPKRDPGWVDESRDSFDPETFSAEHDSVPAPAPATSGRKSRAGVLFLLLIVISAGGAAAMYYFL